MKRRDRDNLRSAEAQQRQNDRSNRSDQEQLTRLEEAGHGHCKEAVKLRENIANGLATKAEVTVAKVKHQGNLKGKNAKGKKARKEAAKK